MTLCAGKTHHISPRGCKWIYLPWKLSRQGWFFVVGTFNRHRMVATLGMLKNRHVKILLENKNDVLKIVPSKARMVHNFAKEMKIKRLGEKMRIDMVVDEGEDSGGGKKINGSHPNA